MSNTVTFGEVSYESDVFGGDNKKRETSKDLFLRLKEGTNEVRIVTSPFQYLVHKYKKDANNPKDFGQKVGCSIMHGSCPLCASGDKARPRWFYGVIDRATGTYKVLDVSFAVFSQIRKLARNPKIGDPTKYDINIEVDKNAPPPQYYTVQNLSKEPLSAGDQQLKDNADLDDLKRRCTPLTPEQVQKRIDKINGVASSEPAAANGKKTAAAAAKAPAKTPAVVMQDENEMAEEFPAYAGDEQA